MELQKLWVSLQLKADEFGQGLDEARKQADGFASGLRGRLGGALGSLQTVGTAAFLGVGAAAEGGFGAAMGAAIDMNASLESSTLQFTTLMGDADKATAHVTSLFEFAANTPYESQQIIDASLKLQTFGGEALNTMDNLTLVGDAAAAVGAPIDEVSFWVGRLYSNLQAGAPFGEAAARLQELGIMGPTARSELEGMQAAGASANDIFSTFQGQLGEFTGAMELQAGTWSGLMSTIKDNVMMAAAEGLKPFFDIAKQGLEGVAVWLSSPEVQEGIQSFAARVTEVIQAIATFVTERVIPFVQEHGPLLKTILIALAGAFAGLLIIGAVTSAIALLTNPITLIIAAIGLLAAAWHSNWGGIRDKVQAVIDFIVPFVQNAIATIRQWWEENGEAILAGVRSAWESVKQIIELAINLIKVIVGAALSVLKALWDQFGDEIMTAIRFAWDTVKTIIGTAIENIKLVIGAFIALFTGDWEGFKTKIGQIWQNTWDAAVHILGNLWGLIQPKLLEIWNSLKGWFDGKLESFKQLGRDVINGIINGLDEVGDKIKQTLVDWATKAWDGVKEFFGIKSPATKGKDAGRNIGEGLIEGVLDSGEDFWYRTEKVFNAYYENIEEWYISRPWAELVEYTTETWQEALVQLWPVTGPRYVEWHETLTEWWITRPWADLVEHTIVEFDKKFATLADRLRPTWDDFWLTAAYVFRDQDWPGIGRGLVDGVVHGVNSNAGSLEAAMRDMAKRALEAAEAELGIASPARATIPIGEAIVDGLIYGINSQQEELLWGIDQLVYEIEEMLGRAGMAGNAATGFAKRLTDTLIAPAEERLEALTATIEGVAPMFAWETGGELILNPVDWRHTLAQLAQLRASMVEQGRASWLVDQVDDAMAALQERNQLNQEYMEQQERLLALEKARADVDFLRSQLEMLKLIQENGMDASILEGLQLGLDADAGALMDTMVDVMNQLVRSAEDELGIHSPSAWAADTMRNVMETMAATAEQERAGLRNSLSRVFAESMEPVLNATEPQVGAQTTDNSRRTTNYGGYYVTVQSSREAWLEEQDVLMR